MRSTSFSGERSRKAALYWSMTVAVSVMGRSSASARLAAIPWRELAAGLGVSDHPRDVPFPERAATLAHRPPDEPAGPRRARRHHAAARELHRTGPIPAGPQRGRAAGGG